MSADISLAPLNRSVKEGTVLHSMPCRIKHVGEAPVAAYFKPLIEQQPDGTLTSYFRGHGLYGRTVPLPPDYAGVVYKELRAVHSDQQEREWTPMSQFAELTYWNRAVATSKGDAVMRMLQFLDISRAVHSPTAISGDQGGAPLLPPLSSTRTAATAAPSPRKRRGDELDAELDVPPPRRSPRKLVAPRVQQPADSDSSDSDGDNIS